MTPAGVLNDLYSFANDGFGMLPYAGLVQATDGKFYGAADTDPGVSIGLLFQITSTGTYTVLLNFTNVTGAYPGAGPQVTQREAPPVSRLHRDINAPIQASISGVPSTAGVMHSGGNAGHCVGRSPWTAPGPLTRPPHIIWAALHELRARRQE
jgi:hypothetical protein